MPGGKYHKSVSFTSPTKLFPSLSIAVMRALPYSIKAHSAAVCQCSSRTPPAVRRMSTPAMVLETGSSRTVTSRDQPPLCKRLCENENGYLKGGTPPASVSGGSNEDWFCASISGLVGPGSLFWRG